MPTRAARAARTASALRKRGAESAVRWSDERPNANANGDVAMNDVVKAMISIQEQALEMQRQQMAMAGKMLDAGRDAVTAQKQGMAAFDAGAKAWRSWIDVWTPKK